MAAVPASSQKTRNLIVFRSSRSTNLNLNQRGGHRDVTERHQNYDVKILAAIAAIWGLSLLSLAYSLILEFSRPAAADDSAAEKPKIAA